MPSGTRPPRTPFMGRPTVHQAFEYATGFVLASAAVRSPDRTVMALAALAVILNTAMLRGPLAAWRVVGTQAHRVLDVIVAVGLCVSAAVLSLDIVTRGELMIAAAVVLWLSVRFSHVVRETRP